jgi:DNA replication and repair protein RecF
VRLQAVLAAARRPFPRIELRYEPSPAGGPDGAQTLFESLAAVAGDELRLGRPCIGPHLDRLSIVWGATDRHRGENGPDVSRVASAGERKALGLLLVAAQAELLEAAGRPPTVLVDDVDAELDLGALEAVWTVLAEGRQVLATTSREEVADRLPGVLEWGLEAGSNGRGPVRK